MPSPVRDGALQLWLTQHATVEHHFSKGLKMLSHKNAWREASFKARATNTSWLLWRPQRRPPHLSDERLTEIRMALQTVTLTTAGTLPVSQFTTEEAMSGQRQDIIANYDGPVTVAGTDGSLLEDGRMGAAVTFLGGRPQELQEEVLGEPSSTTAELVALRLAVQNSPWSRPLVILTDSHNALQELEHCQRSVFRKRTTPRESQAPLHALIEAINEFANQNEITLCKVRAHCGNPLNERADELAVQAAHSSALPAAQGPCLQCKFRYDGGPLTQWSARLSAKLVQEQAFRTLRIPEPRAADDDTDNPDPPKPTDTQQWLTTSGAYRHVLGQVVYGMDFTF